MFRILFFVILSCCAIGCSKDTFDEVDLFGKWRWWSLHHGNDIVFEFNPNDTLTIHNENEVWNTSYEYYSDNTIRIEIGDSVFTDRLQIEIYSIDSIEIIGFTISLIPEEPRSTILSRIEK